MCGFAGIFFPNKFDYENIYNMSDSIRHRGPDQFNELKSNNLVFHHNRLKIISLEGGFQPVQSSISGNVMLYNGEIYNYIDLANDLKKNNEPSIDFNSDTHVGFEYINQKNIENALKKFNGMFSFMFFDKQNGKIYLARDKFGQKPLYYYFHDNKLIFASEIRALLKNDEIATNSKYNLSAISSYLFYDNVPGHTTQYQNIFKVLPGQLITFELNEKIINLVTKRFYETKSTSDLAGDNFVLENQLENSLLNSVKSHLVSDMPVAGLLSGGLDSSLICAMASKFSKIETFTVGFEEESHDETYYAEYVANELNLKNNKIILSNKNLADLTVEALEKNDELFCDPSFISTYALFKEVSNSYKVAIGGDGADELFFGYKNFVVNKFSKLLQFRFSKFFVHYLYKLMNILSSHKEYMNISYMLKQLEKGCGKNTQFQSFYFLSSFDDVEINKLTKYQFSKENLFQYDDLYNQTKSYDIFELQSQFIKNYLPNIILQKIDRASMLNCVECRSPFLDLEFFNISSKLLKKNYKLRKPKKALEKIFNKYLPKKVLKRKKHGFTPPVYNILNEHLKDYVYDNLMNTNNFINMYFNKKYIQKLLDDHFSLKTDNKKKIWSLLVLSKTLSN